MSAAAEHTSDIQLSRRRSARLIDAQEAKVMDSESRYPLPSPPVSGSPGKKARRRHSLPSTVLKSEGADADRKLDLKRKRSQEEHDPDLHSSHESTAKRTRTSPASCAPENKIKAGDINCSEARSIDRWIETIPWPQCSFDKGFKMSQNYLARKRSSSATSYTQSVKEGENPPSHTPEYERKVLAPAGIILDHQIGEATITPVCKELCTTLLSATYELPQNSLFEGDLFWKVMNSIRSRNEPRVVRDIGPYVVPSAEHLEISGSTTTKHLREEIQAEWTKCESLAGPTSKPDFTVGFSSSAFTEDEIEELKAYSTRQKPTEMVEGLYFPFLICEAKCGEAELNYADRQNARSASTAVNAMLQLYREGEIPGQGSGSTRRVFRLNRKILVFSISHDHSMIRIYGHYALIGDEKTTFHRHLVSTFDLMTQDGESRWTSYNFVRKVYDHFAPIHLERIRNAITCLRESRPRASLPIDTTDAGSQMSDSQEMGPPPRGAASYRKARLTTNAMLKKQLDDLLQQLHEQGKENHDLRVRSDNNDSVLRQENRELREEISKMIQENRELREQMNKMMDSLIPALQK